MKRSSLLPLIILAVVFLVVPLSAARAAISFSGNVEPDPTTWSGTTTGYVGNTSDGTLTVDAGDTITSSIGYLGNRSGVLGVVTVDGAGSTWINSNYLNVGGSGTGILNIVGGGSVSAGSSTSIVGCYPGSSGTIHFGPGGGTLSAGGLYAAGSQLTGTGTLSVNGLVSDMDVVFDSTHGLSQTFTMNHGAITVNLNMSNSPSNLGVGHGSSGSLTIRDGLVVNSTGNGFLGFQAGSMGAATVDGSGSTWACSVANIGYMGNGLISVVNGGSFINDFTWIGEMPGSSGTLAVGSTGSASTRTLIVGNVGTGVLSVTGGGSVSSDSSYIGRFNISSTVAAGTATVSGSGSTWTTSRELYIGCDGDGVLNILNGGSVNCREGYIGYDDWLGQVAGTGTVAVSGTGSQWTSTELLGIGSAGSLTISNGAVVNSTNGGIIGGVVTVNGNDSHWMNGNLAVSANAILNVTNGGSVTSGECCISAVSGTSTVTVSGSSSWTNSGTLYVGDGDGTAMLVVTSGGTVVNGSDSYIGQYSSPSIVTVDGTGSTFISINTLYFGDYGEGMLNITNGGNVYSTSSHILSAGSISIDGAGSTWTNSGPVDFGYAYGILSITNGGLLCANGINCGNAVTFNFNGGTWKPFNANAGITSGNGYIQEGGATFDSDDYDMYIGTPLQHGGTQSNDGGITKLGDGALTLTKANSYTGTTTIKAGTLTLIGHNTTTPSAWDPVLNLGGANIEGGMLVFDYTGGTSPADTIAAILDVSYGAGGPLSFALSNNAKIFSETAGSENRALGWVDNGIDKVTVMYTFYGDTNLDGSVNGTDLNAVLSYYNQDNQFWSHGDFNYDGSINGTDLNAVLSNFNQSLSSSAAAVPEPAGAFLLAVMTLAGLVCLARRRIVAVPTQPSPYLSLNGRGNMHRQSQ